MYTCFDVTLLHKSGKLAPDQGGEFLQIQARPQDMHLHAPGMGTRHRGVVWCRIQGCTGAPGLVYCALMLPIAAQPTVVKAGCRVLWAEAGLCESRAHVRHRAVQDAQGLPQRLAGSLPRL